MPQRDREVLELRFVREWEIRGHRPLPGAQRDRRPQAGGPGQGPAGGGAAEGGDEYEHNWDQRLRSALLDAARLDGEEALSALGEEPEFSPAYRAARARLLRSPFRSTAGWARRAVRWAACAGLVLCLSAGSVFLFSPSARAWAVRMWSIWHREYTEYNFHGTGTDPAPLGVWRPSYVPEGYVEWNKNETGILRSIDYVNEEDYLLSLTYMPLCENVSIMLDNEHSVFSRTTQRMACLPTCTQRSKRTTPALWSGQTRGLR